MMLLFFRFGGKRVPYRETIVTHGCSHYMGRALNLAPKFKVMRLAPFF
jgi:hypothetical protein